MREIAFFSLVPKSSSGVFLLRNLGYFPQRARGGTRLRGGEGGFQGGYQGFEKRLWASSGGYGAVDGPAPPPPPPLRPLLPPPVRRVVVGRSLRVLPVGPPKFHTTDCPQGTEGWGCWSFRRLMAPHQNWRCAEIVPSRPPPLRGTTPVPLQRPARHPLHLHSSVLPWQRPQGRGQGWASDRVQFVGGRVGGLG